MRTEPSAEALKDVPGCRFCAAPLTSTVVDLGMSPLCESFLSAEQLDQMEPFYPLHVRICDRCHLVQLPAYVAPEQIFTEYAYYSSYSQTFVQHAHDYVEMIVGRLALSAQNFVVEVGSNDGYLLRHFVERGVPVLGVEPARNVAAAAVAGGVPTLVTFFGSATAERLVGESRRADLLIANNVLSQAPHLNDFVAGLKTLLAPGGVLTVEFPHLMRLLEDNLFDTIYHEHYSYFSLRTASRVFSAHGLTVFDLDEITTHGGSLRLYLRHQEDASRAVSSRVLEFDAREQAAGLATPEPYAAFMERAQETKRELLELLIQAKRQGKHVAGYGAPGKANTLLNYCGIRTDLLDYTVDRSPYKHSLYLPGTHIPIFAPEKLAQTKPDAVWILPWNLKAEIVDQLSYAREWGATFLVAIPRVEVLP
ncbi:MAG: methyltransferase domain-containing protein [Gaiellaceae bacterium]